MNQSQNGDRELDALAGLISPTGRMGDYLAEAMSQWALTHWSAESDNGRASAVRLCERMRQVTGNDDAAIAGCLAAGSQEDLLQWAIVLCRRHHQLTATDASDSDSAGDDGGQILCAVGSDHGRGMVGRMASGRADLREAGWPLVPGFVHAPFDSLPSRIDDRVAMVLISPLDLHDRMQPVTGEQLTAIRQACDQHHACLVIDHRCLPPMGGGHFWVHDSIAEIAADAVLMSAGLTGGGEGGVLVLNSTLWPHLAGGERSGSGSNIGEREMPVSAYVAETVNATLDQWLTQSWQSVEVDSFATSLAERLAARESVRDLHVVGRTIGIELDLPSLQWVQVAAGLGLVVATAGDFAVRLQPPLILDADAQADLLDRIDMVFKAIEAEEQRSDEPAAVDASDEISEPDVESETALVIDESASEESGADDDLESDDFEAEESEADEVEDGSEEGDEDFEEEGEYDEADEFVDEDDSEDEDEDDEYEEEVAVDAEYTDDADEEVDDDDDDFDEDDDVNDEDEADLDEDEYVESEEDESEEGESEEDDDELEEDDAKRSQIDGEPSGDDADDSDSKTDPETQL
ncbi:aminotransferase class III-fold pyridoxal phosphate-dependent enzyme [Aporhodopirellula aestuarii]|uniref:Aminotransferase class III-fold pyridoxal phosphate-dependent enzyme n=1 Tax=Aporhodopirellula aestuarii TaxID=2950107 RepID=A0ABT0UAN0_9BACT|nr:aminotransferase class III-fold pyridoxal phosphate-dependent enzyme [Aporhodopirellula aestuarii]MCM2374067.1 aminotransferase class III-fold pyridoxal phosphate-dependent enzyme [Aporhodopirellula aestuarii]